MLKIFHSFCPPSGGVAGEGALPRRADVIVTEIFDSELLGEGLLPSLRDACARLLAAGGAVIPARAVLWGQLVQSSVLRASTVSPLLLQFATFELTFHICMAYSDIYNQAS